MVLLSLVNLFIANLIIPKFGAPFNYELNYGLRNAGTMFFILNSIMSNTQNAGLLMIGYVNRLFSALSNQHDYQVVLL